MSENTNLPCCVCLIPPKTHACVPCGHKCLCEGCAFIIMNGQDLTEKKCPICREPTSCIIHIYDDIPIPSPSREKTETVESRYIPTQYVEYEDPWRIIDIDDCPACRRSKMGICYTHLYVSGAPVEYDN